MSQSSSDKPSPILMLAPLAFVLIGYQYVFNSSQSSQLDTLRRQAEGLAQKQRGIQAQERTLHKDLVKARQEMTALNTERGDLDTKHEQLEQRRTELRGNALVSNGADGLSVSSAPGPAGTMQAVCAVFRTHDLILHQNSTPATKTQGASDEEQRELARLLDVERTESQVYRVTLQGRFSDLQNALHELRNELSNVRLIAISLEAAPPTESLRTWVLDLAV